MTTRANRDWKQNSKVKHNRLLTEKPPADCRNAQMKMSARLKRIPHQERFECS